MRWKKFFLSGDQGQCPWDNAKEVVERARRSEGRKVITDSTKFPSEEDRIQSSWRPT